MDQVINGLEKLKKHEKINEIMEDNCKKTDEAAEKIISLLKENCETYGDLMIKTNRLKTTIVWGGKTIMMRLIDRCEELVKEEMNDIKIITEEKMTLNDIRKKYDLPEEEGDMNNRVLVESKLCKQELNIDFETKVSILKQNRFEDVGDRTLEKNAHGKCKNEKSRQHRKEISEKCNFLVRVNKEGKLVAWYSEEYIRNTSIDEIFNRLEYIDPS